MPTPARVKASVLLIGLAVAGCAGEEVEYKPPDPSAPENKAFGKVPKPRRPLGKSDREKGGR
jgi:hypothetical protein